MTHDQIFYISSDTELKSKVSFYGYAFFESNLIIGGKGFEDFLSDNSIITRYEDGNYVLIEPIHSLGGTVVSRDYHGYYPLFYYNSEEFWCVSSSIIYIAEQLKIRGLQLEVNEHNIEIWKSNLAFALQLTSHNTFIKNINVLPVDQDILITHKNSSISLVKRTYRESENDKYEDLMSEAVSIWLSRYKTILNCEELALVQDLTGGVDSRAIFSYLINGYNLQLSKESVNKKKLKIGSNINHEHDFEVANNISEVYRTPLNTAIADRYSAQETDPEENYLVWKYFNLGRYSPIIFPLTDFNPRKIEIGGESGEDNRNFFGKQPDGSFQLFDEYINSYARFFSSQERFNNWKEEIESAVSKIRENSPFKKSSIDTSILHYKEFRSNCHSSKNPFSRFRFSVLGSRYFDQLISALEEDAIKSNQVLFDLMYNLDSKILYIEFDDVRKNIKLNNVKKLTTIEDKFKSESLLKGKVYWSDIQEESIYFVNLESIHKEVFINSNYGSALEVIYDKAKLSLSKNKRLIKYFFGEGYIERFEKNFKELELELDLGLKTNLHTQGAFLHSLILIDFIDNLVEYKEDDFETSEYLAKKYIDSFDIYSEYGDIVPSKLNQPFKTLVLNGDYQAAEVFLDIIKEKDIKNNFSIKINQFRSHLEKVRKPFENSLNNFKKVELKPYDGIIKNLDFETNLREIDYGKFRKDFSVESFSNFNKDFSHVSKEIERLLVSKNFNMSLSKQFPLRIMVMKNAKFHTFNRGFYTISDESDVYDTNNAAFLASLTRSNYVSDKFKEKKIKIAFVLPFEHSSINYYHNLIECFFGLRYFDYEKYNYPIVYTEDRFNIVSFLCERLNIPVDRFVSIKELGNTIIEKAICFYRGAYTWDSSIYDFAGKIKNKNILPSRLLYISRSKSSRALSNEDDVESMLINLGFEIIYAEELKFSEQVDLFSEASFVVTPHGAGLTNICFMEKGTRLVEIFEPNMIKADYYLRSTHNSLDYDCIITDANRSVNLDELKKLIKSKGV